MNPKPRILIVDDDSSMTRTLGDILSMSGYAPVEACSGSEALEKVRTQFFDCVLTDVKMPGMSGVELHHQLHLEKPGLPVILMTAYAAGEIIHQGLEQGIVGVFDKPLNINLLLGFFTSLVNNHIIAIVDDDPIFCKMLGDILRQRGFSTIQISDPPIDLEPMASGAQAILLDMKLNGTTGLDVLKAIRQRYPTLPVLLVTGYRQEMAAAIQAAFEINAFACLYKPLEIPALLQTLGQLQLTRLRATIKSK